MITIWHNPRCSKSRQTLALLHENGHAPTERRYLEDAPTLEELRAAQAALGVSALDMCRTKEAEFKEAGLTRGSSDEAILAAMVTYPRLIERPIVFANGKARVGRPPEAVLDII